MAAQPSGFFSSALWSRLILQVCESEATIRHAVTAIAALKKTSEVMQLSSGESVQEKEEVQAHCEFALRQYGKAIKSMRQDTAGGTQELRTTLISCIVITCFEIYHGNHDVAVKQIGIGKDLITEQLLGRASGVEDELLQAFGALDLQAMTFLDPRTPEQHRILKNFGQGLVDDMPGEFQSLEQAKSYLELNMQRMMHFLASVLPHHFVGCMKQDNSLRLLDEHLEERDRLLSEMRRWRNAFAPLLQRARRRPRHKMFVGATALELVYKTSYFESADICSSSQPGRDTYRFMPLFEEILSLAKSILSHPSVTRENVTFAFEMQVVCPLYAVAWRCPQWKLRREAIAILLSWPRREGLWDGLFAGKLAEWTTLMEEGLEEDYVRGDLRRSGVDVLEFSMAERW